MDFLIKIILTILFVVLSIFYLYIKRKQSYWSVVSDSIPYTKPTFLFGNFKIGIFAERKHLAFQFQDLYRKFKGHGPFGGIYFFHKPTVLAIDLNFIKNIFIKDFSHFINRSVYYNENDDPLSAHLFAIDGEKWRILRKKLTPTFTSGKMKFMFPTIVEVGKQLEHCLLSEIKIDNVIEMKDILGRFTTDVIGTCAFGIDCNSLANPNSEFRRMGKQIFENPRNTGLKRGFILSFPDFARFMHIKVLQNNVAAFFLKIVRDTINYRHTNCIERNDFMDLLIKLKEKNDENDLNENDEKNNENNDSNGEKLTFNEIAAQAFVFFAAGFETSSTVMSFCLFELANNEVIQRRARIEIQKVLKNHNGQFTYEAMLEMNYLDHIINETLRKYPPVAVLSRVVTKDYYVPEIKYTIPKYTSIFVPVYALQHDPEYYPDPERFDPERFSKIEVAKRNPMTFLPFGDGPRNCIGLRFGLMQARVGLVALLTKFKFSTSSKLKIPLIISNKPVLSSEHGIHLTVETII